MTGIHDHLVKKSISGKLVYTAELIPQAGRQGELFVDNLYTDLSSVSHQN